MRTAVLLMVMLVAPRARAEPDARKDPTTAAWLGIGGAAAATIGSLESLRVLDRTASPSTERLVVAADVVGLLALPSFGSFYAHDADLPGVGIRAAGIGALALAAWVHGRGDDEPVAGVLGGVGILAIVTGTIYSASIGGDAARAYNRDAHLTVVPTFGAHSTIGVAISGAY